MEVRDIFREGVDGMKKNRSLLLLALFQFALFVPLAWWARRHPQPPVELAITHAFQRKRSRPLHTAMQALSVISGSDPLLNIIVVPTAYLLWKRNWRVEALFTLAISWSNELVRAIVKRVTHRPRPNPLLIAMSDHKRTKSFPSGHVCASVDYWGWLAAIFLFHGKTLRHQALAGFSALCLACVGPTRIYLGDHWLTDVLGGYLLGGGWLSLSLHLYLTQHEQLRSMLNSNDPSDWQATQTTT